MSSVKGIANAKIRDSKMVTLTCSNCGAEYQICYGRYRRIRNKAASSFRCKKCFPKLWYSDLSEEERNKFILTHKERWNNKSPEEKARLADISKIRWKNMTEEEKINHGKISSENMKKYWNDLSEEEYQRRVFVLRIIYDEYIKNRTPEQRMKTAKIQSENMKRRWKEMSPEIYEKHQKQTSDAMKFWWDNLTDEERRIQSKKVSDATKEWWINMSDEERIIWDKKRIIGVMKYYKRIKNNFTKTENQFISILNLNNIVFQTHYANKNKHPDFDNLFPFNPITKGTVSPYHEWDFKINLSEVSILVDIDGSIHDSEKTNSIVRNNTYDYFNLSEFVSFNDSKRPYQTDGLDAYIVKCYTDEILNSNPVINIKTNEVMSLCSFIEKINFMNLSIKEQNELLKECIKK